MVTRSLSRTAAVGLAGAAILLVGACGGSASTKVKPTPGSSSPAEATAPQLVQAGLAALKQGDTAAATSAFTDAIGKDPASYYAYYNLGVIAQQAGKSVQALQNYGLALNVNPKYVPALFNEATIYGATNPTLAVTTYRQVISLQPTAPTAYLNLGLLEAKLGMTAQAKIDLQTALTQDGSLTSDIPKDIFDTPRPTTAPASPVGSASPTPTG